MATGDRTNQLQTGLTVMRTRLNQESDEMDNERSSFMARWKDLGNYNMPYAPRFNFSDTNKGQRKDNRIINETAAIAVRVLSAGFMSGITNPSSAWFELAAEDQGLNDVGSVKHWLDVNTKRMRTILLKTNFYSIMPSVYSGTGVFGTTAFYAEKDEETTTRFYPIPIGSFALANDEKLRIRRFKRDFRMTVEQIIEKFARNPITRDINWDVVSSQVRSHWEENRKQTWIDVRHFVIPNEEYDPNKIGSQFKKFRSIYYEVGTNSGNTRQYPVDAKNDILQNGGIDLFRVIAPRWEITGEDVYATNCPGMLCQGTNRALQTKERRKAQALEKKVSPPMVGPAHLKNAAPTILPGGITYTDERSDQKGFRVAHEVNFQIGELEQDILADEARIKECYFTNLFTGISQIDRSNVTATQINKMEQEMLLQTGPFLERFDEDALTPLIDILFHDMLEDGLITEPPPELEGQPLKVVFVSRMAQAQKLANLSSIERYSEYIGSIAAMTQTPDIFDKMDFDQSADEYGEALGLGPTVVRTDEDVAEIREARLQAQQAQQQQEAIANAAKTAKDLSQADMEGDNALTRLIDEGNASEEQPV